MTKAVYDRDEVVVASDRPKYQASRLIQTALQTFILASGIVLPFGVNGVIRVIFDLSAKDGYTVVGILTKNKEEPDTGHNLGVEQTETAAGLTEHAQDIDVDVLNPGESIDLWIRCGTTSGTVKTEHIGVYYD